MNIASSRFAAAAVFTTMSVFATTGYADDDRRFYNGRDDDYYDGRGFYGDHGQKVQDESVQLGPRPFYLVERSRRGTPLGRSTLPATSLSPPAQHTRWSWGRAAYRI
jgi:hypothetical protein